MTEPSNREREIFCAALECATRAERVAHIDRACGDDAALRARVETLLRAHEQAGRFLDEPGAVSAGSDASIREGPGTRICRYRVLERIGEGGFGVVYMAEQEEPVRRRVALKIIKLGMDTRAVVARFEAERQALAMMEHPNIAKVLDGGATETGRPYFVMELVRGVPITTYCGEHRLSTHERLDLFMHVCHAVQHAHQKGVIHRDLKPSNILVTMHDDRPVPKVIDFGIAKATDHRLTEKTLFTRFHQFVGTPAYMSPEQTGISGLDIDTRSDIYSLGVLLYELLTDHAPFDNQALLAAGYEEIHRTIREKDPPPPSTRLASLNREERTTTAQRRRLDPARLTTELRGDLDRIVMKCLEKNRARRYDTANGLALDVSRYLNHEPVLARSPTARYRMAKFMRRHRKAAAFGVVLLVAVTIGMVGTLVQARRADRAARTATEQRDFALRQLSRAEAINDLNAYLLSDAAPAGKPFTTGELLARAERIVDRENADTIENRVEMLVAVGRHYQAIDEDAKARETLNKAYALARNVSDRSVRAKAACALASAIARVGEFERAENLVQQALIELGDESQFALHRVFCLLCGREVAGLRGDQPTAIARMQLARRILNDSRQGSRLLDLRVSMNLAESYRNAGMNREAAIAFKEVWGQLSALGRDETYRACVVLNNWGMALYSLGQPLEAERHIRRALAIASTDESQRGVSPMLLINFARVLVTLKRLDESAAVAERAHAIAQTQGEEVVINHTLSVRASIHLENGELDRAADLISELDTRYRRTLPAGHVSFASVFTLRSRLALARGKANVALTEADRAVMMLETKERSDLLPPVLLHRAEVRMALGDFVEARSDAGRALGVEEQAIGSGSYSSTAGRAHLKMARSFVAQRKFDDARAAFGSAFEHLRSTLGAEHPETREAIRGASTER